MKQEKWDKLHKELDNALQSAFEVSKFEVSKQFTAVEWFVSELMSKGIINADGWVWDDDVSIVDIIEQAKEMEKNNIDNKVIHFAEWLTKKHTSTLITLYEHFEEEYYKETFKSE